MLKLITLLSLLAVCSSALAQEISYPSFGKGIKVIAGDSSASININVRFQNLFEADYDDNTNTTSTKFLVRRQRLKFNGFVLDKDFRYKIELGFSNRDQGNAKTSDFGNAGANIVLEAVAQYYLTDKLDLWIGQTKVPGNRAKLISSGDMQLVDRSILNSNFSLDRDAGVQLKYEYGTDFIVKPTLAVTMGEGSNITASNTEGFDYTLRLDFLPLGDFSDFEGSDMSFSESHKLAIGGAISYNDGTNRQGGQIGSFVYDTSEALMFTDLTTIFADLMYKYEGISFMAEYANRKAKDKFADLEKGFLTGEAMNFQVGYLFRNYWELSARYSYVKPDNDYSAIPELDEYTFGISKYLKKHKLKLQTDCTYFDNYGIDKNKDIRYRFQIEVQL
jgi:hypothetical protein